MIANPTLTPIQSALARMRNAAMPSAQLPQPGQPGQPQLQAPMQPGAPAVGSPGAGAGAGAGASAGGGFTGPSASAMELAYNSAGGAASLPPAVAAGLATSGMTPEQAFQRVMQNRPQFAQRVLSGIGNQPGSTGAGQPAVNGGGLQAPMAPAPGISDAIRGLRQAVGGTPGYESTSPQGNPTMINAAPPETGQVGPQGPSMRPGGSPRAMGRVYRGSTQRRQGIRQV